MVHLDPETLRRFPILGVAIGAATAAFLCYLLWAGWPEASVLLRQRAPESLSLHEVVGLRGTRWVTVSDGQWHCERAITIERRVGLERWVRGPVESTEVPITGASEREVLVASFDGAVTCAQRARLPLTGVVGSTQIFTSRGALRRWGEGGDRVAVLQVGASPRFVLVMLVGLVAVAIGGAAFATYYLVQMFRSAARHSVPLSASDPIQPS